MTAAYLSVSHKAFPAFLGVGLLGIVVNTLSLVLLHGALGLPLIAASLLASELALLVNFGLHRLVTLRGDQPLLHSAWLFHGSSFVTVALIPLLLWTGVTALELPYMAVNLGAALLASTLNYVLFARWLWIELPLRVAGPGTHEAWSRWPALRGLAAQRPAIIAAVVVSVGIIVSTRLGAWTPVAALLPGVLMVWLAGISGRKALAALLAAVVAVCTVAALWSQPLAVASIGSWVSILVLGISLALFAQSLFSLYLMLYSWEHPEQLRAASGPTQFLPPELSFTVLLPARHEEAVIFETIRRVCSAVYPQALLEVVVICHADDGATIAEAERAVRLIGADRVRVETFASMPINKPHGLNVGLRSSSNEIVTIFDAEDDIDPNIFNVINTIMVQETVGVVQAGVQLMNFRDRWFGIHNCLEYFFWFKSRLHFHAALGMIPLGGNTVFIRRPLLERVRGWDEQCLTEDADVGIRLSVLGHPIRVVYNAQHVTREEAPESIGAFVKQRSRWHQGFLQVLLKGDWRALPKLSQRLLAFYTLSYPFVQALLLLLWPAMILMVLWLKLPVPVTIATFLPLYALLLQLLAALVGTWLFTREYGLRFPVLLPVGMALTFLPFQWLQGISAVRAVGRVLAGRNNWEKTAHSGAHRRVPTLALARMEQLLTEACLHLGAERGSVMALDQADNTLSIVASQGLSRDVVAGTRVALGDGLAGYVAQHGQPILVGAGAQPTEITRRLRQPQLLSSLIVPIKQQGITVAVINLASAAAGLPEDAAQWLYSQIQLALAERDGMARRGSALRPLPQIYGDRA